MSHKTRTFVPFHYTCWWGFWYALLPHWLKQPGCVLLLMYDKLIVRDLIKHVNVITINTYSWMEEFQETSWDGQQNTVMHRMFGVNIELYPIQYQKSDNLINPYPYQRDSGSSQVDCFLTKTYNINTKHGSKELLSQALHSFFTGPKEGFPRKTLTLVSSSSGSILHNCRDPSSSVGFPTGCRSHDLQKHGEMDADTSSEQNAEKKSGMLSIVLFNPGIIPWYNRDIIHCTGYNWKPYDISFYWLVNRDPYNSLLESPYTWRE